jgi:anti-sigma factor RsiW
MDHATPEKLLDLARDRLTPAEKTEVEEHLAGCDTCKRAASADRELDGAVTRLPAPAAPAGPAKRVEARFVKRRRGLAVAAGLAAGVIAITAFVLVWAIRRDTNGVLLREVVNDHLRLLSAVHPIEIETSDMNQIKPWFTGRLDFAPGLSFAGDAVFPLHGAAVGWFLDRKCATYVFAKAEHKITLLVLPAAALDWPKRYQARERGFETLLWRDGDLAYALVSDTEAAELAALASRLTRK